MLNSILIRFHIYFLINLLIKIKYTSKGKIKLTNAHIIKNIDLKG